MRYTKNKLEKLADDVVSLAKTKGDSLVDSVLSVLKANPMNPEQIKRLVEMTNTSKFLDEFSDTFGEDRFVDFDVLDPDDIINQVLGGGATKGLGKARSKSLSVTLNKMPGGTLVSKKEENSPGLDTEETRFFEDIENTKEKSASFTKIAKEELISTEKYNKSPALIGKQVNLPDKIQKGILTHSVKQLNPHDEKKIEEKLHTKKEGASWACDELASKLSSYFRGVYSRDKHAAFEVEALANYGIEGLPALQAVRTKLGKELFSSGTVTEKQIKEASDRYLSDKSSLGMQEVGQYIEKMGQYIDACLELNAFYSHIEKTSMLGATALGGLGLAVTGGSLLQNPLSTTSYVLNKRIHNWADRIEARDETLKDIRKKVVDYTLDSFKGKADRFFDDRKDSSKAIERKQRRMVAAARMFKDNPDLRSMGRQNSLMAINMVGKVAPELSTSVPFLTAHVKQMVYNSDGGTPVIDANSLKSMSDAERAYENLGEFKPA